STSPGTIPGAARCRAPTTSASCGTSGRRGGSGQGGSGCGAGVIGAPSGDPSSMRTHGRRYDPTMNDTDPAAEPPLAPLPEPPLAPLPEPMQEGRPGLVLACGSDDAYALHLGVMLYSVVANLRPHAHLDVYLIDGG